MRFCLIRVPSGGPSTEVAVVVPGAAERTAIVLPLLALPDFLPLLHEATESLGEQRCECCATPLPGGPPMECR